jgi:protein-L-isoaspartate(D-aspartate) O-methyltransferase
MPLRTTWRAALLVLPTVRSWMSSAKTNDGLVTNLIRDGVVEKGGAVEKALRRLDRKNFAGAVAPAFGRGGGVDDRTAYADAPVPIGPRATISAPHMHGRCLELLAPPLLAKAQARVLDVGSGSGYLTAAFALLGPGIEAYGVDRDAGLVALSIKNVARDNLLQKELGDRVRFERRDGWTGLPDYGPYDAIHVGAAAETIPDALLDQLARGGRMIIPVGGVNAAQALVQVDRDAAGTLSQKTLFGVRYVELVDERGSMA